MIRSNLLLIENKKSKKSFSFLYLDNNKVLTGCSAVCGQLVGNLSSSIKGKNLITHKLI